ncbi:MAG TPA: metallophosphoesterase [Thermoleophilia bacterium]|nr:metallophosphoesterase [Thermoleophilia bacterium]
MAKAKKAKTVLPQRSHQSSKPQPCANPLCDTWFHPDRGAGGLYCSMECAGVAQTLASEKYSPKLFEKLIAMTREIAPKLLIKTSVKGPAIVTADWHAPSIHTGTLARMLSVAKRTRIKTLMIVGDFMDMRAFSGHKKIEKGDTHIIDAQAQAQELIAVLATQFDRIYLAPGNHDYWLVQYFNGAESYTSWMTHIFRPFFEKGILRVSEYPYLFVTSKRDDGKVARFACVHQRTFSGVNPAGVGRDMEARRPELRDHNIITTHSHLEASARTWPGSHMVYSLGCMTDPDRTSYPKRFPTRHGAWNGGFGIIDRGWCFTMNDLMPSDVVDVIVDGLRKKRKPA